jgi:hypothetical protein
VQLHRQLFVAVAVSLAAFVHQLFVQLPFLQLLFLLFIAVAVPWLHADPNVGLSQVGSARFDA